MQMRQKVLFAQCEQRSLFLNRGLGMAPASCRTASPLPQQFLPGRSSVLSRNWLVHRRVGTRRDWDICDYPGRNHPMLQINDGSLRGWKLYGQAFLGRVCRFRGTVGHNGITGQQFSENWNPGLLVRRYKEVLFVTNLLVDQSQDSQLLKSIRIVAFDFDGSFLLKRGCFQAETRYQSEWFATLHKLVKDLPGIRLRTVQPESPQYLSNLTARYLHAHNPLPVFG